MGDIMKTNTTLAIILLVLLSACASNPPTEPTMDVPASQTLAYETAIVGANETAMANAPTATLPPSVTSPPTATDTPTSTPIPTYTPLPELSANAIDLQWITAYGLPGDQCVTTIHPTRDGGFLLESDGRLLKLRADGLIEWQTSLPQVNVLGILETGAGDFILAGDQHWIKLDSQGALLWQHPLEGASYHTGPIIRLVEESNGNIVVEAAGRQAVFNTEGELQSFTQYETPESQADPGNVIDRLDENQFDGVFFIQPTADDGALVGSYAYSDYGDVASIVTDVIISGVSKDGSVRWQKGYGGYFLASYDDVLTFETRSGDIIIAGTLTYFANQADRKDVWILRLDRNGNSRWDKLYATDGQDAVTVIQELSNGDLIFAGQTSGVGTGGQDMWVLKTNAQGEIPNCGLVFDGSAGTFGSFPQETTTLEDEQRLYNNADAQAIPLCSPSP
jgi:hypothetical protein